MKKSLLVCLLLMSFVCFGCKNNNDNGNDNNNDNNFDEFVVEEVTVEENGLDENNDNENKDNNNEDEDVFFTKGKEILENNGNINEAIELFNKALEINDKADWIYGDLGRAKAENEDFEGAIESYTKAIELNNKRSIYYGWRADAYRMLGKEDLAEKDQKIADELHAKGMD